MFKLVLFLWITNGVSMTDLGWFKDFDTCQYAGTQAQLNSTIQDNRVAVGYTCVPDHNWQDK